MPTQQTPKFKTTKHDKFLKSIYGFTENTNNIRNIKNQLIEKIQHLNPSNSRGLKWSKSAP